MDFMQTSVLRMDLCQRETDRNVDLGNFGMGLK